MGASAPHPIVQRLGEAEGGRLSQVGRLWVLETRGSGRARGRQHGSLLRAQVHAGVAPRLARRAFELPTPAAAHPADRDALHEVVRQVYEQLWCACPEEIKEELAGLAAAADIEVDVLFRASFLSEALQLLLGSFVADAGAARSHGGCTAALAKTSPSVGRAFLHAKNQDYHAGGLWDKFPLVHIARPEGGLAHVSATSVGLLKGNLTLNAAGVSIGGHFLFSRTPGKKGRSFTTLEREIALRACDVESALAIIREVPTFGSFAFVIADPNHAVVAECDGGGVEVRAANSGTLGMANLFTASERGMEADLLRGWRAHRNPHCRQARVDQLLGGLVDGASVADLAAILADRFDPSSGRRRGPGPVIAQPTTVTSAIVDNAQRQFWVGEGSRPSSHGTFIGFDLAATFSDGNPPKICGAFSTALRDHDAVVRAFRLYLAAQLAFDKGADGETRARELLIEAELIDPEEAAYPRFLCRLLLRAGMVDEAGAAIQRALARAQNANESAECHLLRGNTADLSDDRESALAAYRHVWESAERTQANEFGWINPALMAQAQTFAHRVFTTADARVLAVPFDLMSGIE